MIRIQKSILVLLAIILAACSSSDDTTQIIVPDDTPDAVRDDDIGTVVKLSQGTLVWVDSTRISKRQETQTYTYSYRSHDAFGDTIRLTALIGWPKANVDPQNLLIGCHITITDDAKAPSNFGISDAASDVGMLMMHAVDGDSPSSKALVIMPDYEGYGGTVKRTHPYLCQELTARQVIDAVRAGMKLFKEQNGQMADGWKTVVAGYSQGGAVAMAVHRMIEQQEGLADELHFCGSVCGAGPYDLIATFRQYVNDDKIYLPAVVPLILKGMCEYMPQLKGYEPSDFLTTSFVDTGVLDMISQKTLSTGDIQERLDAYAKEHPEDLKFYFDDGGDYLKANMVLRPECIAYLTGENVSESDRPKMEALMQALKANTVWGPWTGFGNWQPKHPIMAFHSVTDEVVPFVNYLQAYDYCQQYFNGRRFSSTFFNTHTSAGYMFFGFHCTSLMEDLLQGKASVTNIDQ